MAPTEEEMEAERTAFQQREAQLKAIEDKDERLEEIMKDEKIWRDKYRRRQKTLNSTCRLPENNPEFLEVLELVYDDLSQAHRFYQDTLSHMLAVKMELHQNADEVTQSKREKAEDFSRHTRIYEELEDEVLQAMRQARKEAQEVEHRNRRREEETRQEELVAEFRRKRLEDEAAITREQQAQAEARARVPAVPPGQNEHRQRVQNPIGKVKRIEIPKFDGKPVNYFKWKASFDLLVKENTELDNSTKYLYLEQALMGEAVKVVAHLEHSPLAFEVAMQTLEEKYGGKHRQMQQMYTKIKDIKPVKDFYSMQEFQYTLVGVHSTMKIHKMNVKDEMIHLQVCEKMNHRLMEEYLNFSKRTEKERNLETLIEFIKDKVQTSQMAYEASSGSVKSQQTHSTSEKSRKNVNNVKKEQSKKPQEKAVTDNSSHKSKKCTDCSGDHRIDDCTMFQARPLHEKVQMIKERGMCFRCLGRGHRKDECKSRTTCGHDGCGKAHHTLVHDDQRAKREDTGKKVTAEEVPAQEKMVSAVSGSQQHVVINLVPVNLVMKSGRKKIRCMALVDSGSNTTLISEGMKRKLGIRGEKRTFTYHHPLTSEGLTREVEVLETVKLESEDGCFKLDLRGVETMPSPLEAEAVDWNRYKHHFSHIKDIKFPIVYSGEKADLLIGADQTCLFKNMEQRVPRKNGDPIATKTELGWLCMGIIPKYKTQKQVNALTGEDARLVYHCFKQDEEEVSQILRRFWEIEQLSHTEEEFSVQNREVLEKTRLSTRYNGERYEVALPFNDRKIEDQDVSFKKDMWKMAMNRLRSTESSLSKNEERKQKYQQVMTGYLEKGFARIAPDPETTKWLLPHFPVIREDKETSKCRIVFDGSAKVKNISLNDQIDDGPKLQRDILNVLLRFRRYPIAINCDIKEMFPGVGVREEDCKYQRILWRNFEDREPDVLELVRVTFGINASPFLSICTLLDHAERYRKKFPEAVESLTSSTYVDDTLDSMRTVEDAVKVYKNMTEICGKAGWKIHKWASNSEDLLKHIPVADRAQGNIQREIAEGVSLKTLGVKWLPEKDEIIGNSTELDLSGKKITKRIVLQKLAKIYDPLGMMCPYVIRCKMLLQEIWMRGNDWDDELDEALKKRTLQWFEDLQYAHTIRQERAILQRTDDAHELELHCFSDASERAYGTVVYIKIIHEREVTIKWVTAKGKVCPLQPVSIPRLELIAATLGAQLTNKVKEALEYKNITRTCMWTDSMTALWWITGRTRDLKMFVGNRVIEILRYTEPSQWRHVPTKENPADLISRGCGLQELSQSELWMEGPDFLRKSQEEWPEQKKKKTREADKEVKKQIVAKLTNHIIGVMCEVDEDCHDSDEEDPSEDEESSDEEDDSQMLANAKQEDHMKKEKEVKALAESTAYMKRNLNHLKVEPDVDYLEPTRFSSLNKLVRVRAWVKRFIANASIPAEERRRGVLKVWELQEAEQEVIATEQQKTFKSEYKALLRGENLKSSSKLLALNPRLDQDGLMRVKGRIRDHPNMTWEMQCPIILPKNNHITDLIISREHQQNHMLGTNHLMGKLKEKYWILCARRQIKTVTGRCPRCKLLKYRVMSQQMGLLPVTRTQMNLRAFVHVGVDMAGPLMIKIGRGKPQQKRWICLFTCLATRAVHLEMCTGLDIDSFMNALARFISRRGVPVSITSDNGTNFHGADNEMRRLYEIFESGEFQDKCSHKRIEWKFNPPGGPHHGGVFEVMIKAAKTALNDALHKRDLTEEELNTALVSVEGMLNQRPLSYVGSDQEDFILTPNHFLHGSLGGMIAPDVLDGTPSFQKKWRHIQDLLKEVWERWLREWVSELNKRKKWHQENENIREGDIVMIIEEDITKRRWEFPLGRVVEVFKGPDELVRSCKVKLADGRTNTKTIQRLAKIESTDDT